MKYKAMPGSIIIKAESDDAKVTTTASGLAIVQNVERGTTEIAEVISVGDEREDIKEGTKVLFPTSTGLKIAKDIYYLKYEDICAIVDA